RLRQSTGAGFGADPRSQWDLVSTSSSNTGTGYSDGHSHGTWHIHGPRQERRYIAYQSRNAVGHQGAADIAVSNISQMRPAAHAVGLCFTRYCFVIVI